VVHDVGDVHLATGSLVGKAADPPPASGATQNSENCASASEKDERRRERAVARRAKPTKARLSVELRMISKKKKVITTSHIGVAMIDIAVGGEAAGEREVRFAPWDEGYPKA
jgi:hypothetical protein